MLRWREGSRATGATPTAGDMNGAEVQATPLPRPKTNLSRGHVGMPPLPWRPDSDREENEMPV